MCSAKSMVASGWQRSVVVTTLFCLFISGMTLSVWGGPYYVHVLVSFGFGYSALFFSWLVDKLFPTIPRMLEIALSLTACLLFGVINAQFLIGEYFGISGMLPVLLMGLLFSGMCYFYFHSREKEAIAQRELESIKRENAEQERALLLSQLKQMQSQIEPHFLFNTLANISALMSQDVDKAKQMLDQLTALLRATLKSSREEHTNVENEVALIDAYLGIQKIRLGERLSYKIAVQDGLERTELPPMMLQPLVENAIVHGIEPKREGGEVSLLIKQEKQQLQIEVKDTGVGLNHVSNHSGSGIGLSNLKQRVDALFSGKGLVSISESAEGGVSVRLSWPIISKEQ
ncbi:TPA: sensor histidine kinase [Vibrio parahaemolyticus]|uniref:sensor histidine kinase n=1 Tax=Vibrio parahaemolyticus TaxID=670 RepID=UPI00079FE674|nr:sensor histidine kinase [Vibrio parahaemolyticus]EGQ8524308.1 sensor histidine kinase [Vibrio parahaemolyticus]EGQ9208305.1 sensor histidine kinase [Vibrio parahaemolyticus]EGQ9785158.1 sensor histidine kinase [Vibrio parahaemolyticus]EGQ9923019.1 sensor histidine kinase [Vibrio parahaemolyticus]EGR0117241.1 sensor histidine kinase [Vibrio parahaemolyticus]